jgi:type I restriction enzyme M protein
VALNAKQRTWFFDQIDSLDPKHKVVSCDREHNLLTYSDSIKSDESLQRSAEDEELVRAVTLSVLASKDFKYETDAFYIERYYKHGHPSSKRDEVDLIILDNDDLPFAMWEFKSPEEYEKNAEEFIQYQLFGTVPLVGAPRLLVYATVKPTGTKPSLTLMCINRDAYPSYESWVDAGRPYGVLFPEAYTDPKHVPLVHGGPNDLRLDCTQADFKAVATTFHAEFFGEHPDNTLFTDLMKCLLAKIFDERNTKKGDEYSFQVFYRKGKQEPAWRNGSTWNALTCTTARNTKCSIAKRPTGIFRTTWSFLCNSHIS